MQILCDKYPIQALKKGKVYFLRGRIYGKVYFLSANFYGKVYFLSANFYGKVYFVFLKVKFTIRYEFI